MNVEGPICVEKGISQFAFCWVGRINLQPFLVGATLWLKNSLSLAMLDFRLFLCWSCVEFQKRFGFKAFSGSMALRKSN